MEVRFKHSSEVLLEPAREALMMLRIDGWQLSDGMLQMNVHAYGGDFHTFEDGLDAQDLVQTWEELADLGDKREYWVASHPSIRDVDGVALTEDNGVFLKESRFEPTWRQWRTVMHGPEEGTRRVIDGLDELDLSPTIEAARRMPQMTLGPVRLPEEVLTDRQREVAATALCLGYYDQPKSCTLDDISAELGISASQVSRHLSQTQHNLLSLLVEDSEPIVSR